MLTPECSGSVPGSPCELRVHCLNNLAACHYQWSHPRQVVYCNCTVLYYYTVCTVLYCVPPPGGRPLLGRAGAAAGHGQGSLQVSGCILSTLWVILPILYRIIGNCVDNSHIRPQCHIQFIQYYSNLQTNISELESDL